MLQRVRGSVLDREPVKRPHGRLDPDLHQIDRSLQVWATWSAGLYGERFPLGLTVTALPRESWPAPVLELDDAVLRLYWTLGSALMATYLRADLPIADRVEVYCGLTQWFAERSHNPRTAAHDVQASRGRGAFRRDLDCARWSLRYALLARR